MVSKSISSYVRNEDDEAKRVLVLTDLFTMYTIAVPLVSTNFADVAREIVENWVLKLGAPNVLHTDQGKSFGGQLIQEMCRFLGIDKTQTSPYKSKGNGQTDKHNAKMADVILKFCAENPRNWARTLPYLNFVYNTTVNRKTEATPFSMVHGEECKYPVDLLYTKPHDELMMKDGFAEWLDEQFRDANSRARELLGTDQRRQKSYHWKKIHRELYASDDKVWAWSQETSKSKKSFDLWEGPYVVMARLSTVRYKLSKVSNPSKVKFLHFYMLKRYDEETLQPEEATARERPTPYRSANFFEDLEMRIEDEAIWANNREEFNHKPGPRQEPVGIMSHRNRAAVEPLVNPLGRNGGLRRQSDAVETNDATKIEARREEEPAKLKVDLRVSR